MASDLVQDSLLFGGQKAQTLHPRQRFRHKWLGKIQPLIAADNVFDAPAHSLRSLQGIFVTVLAIHNLPSLLYFAASSRLQRVKCANRAKPKLEKFS
jgi:hypothetical protein